MSEALRRQLERRAELLAAGAEHVGWKIGAGIPEIGEPLIGYLTSATVFAPGATVDVSGARDLHVEVELLIEVGGGVGVAIELVDTARPPATAAEIIERNVFHHAAVLGRERVAAVPEGARAHLLREHAAVTTDVPLVVEHVGVLLGELGVELFPGDLILAGSLLPLPPATPIIAEIDGVDRVAANLKGLAL